MRTMGGTMTEGGVGEIFTGLLESIQLVRSTGGISGIVANVSLGGR